MPLSDRDRIAAERDAPRIVDLWRALTALRSVVSFMNTGAHPDDETSAMLAAMRFRDGIDISFACSTRGEGGQNGIGTETTAALGVLRTAEMERACDRLDLRMYWLSESPGDTVFDFGFSKSGVETLGRWGRERTLSRFVDIIRRERPDIICPTFLDVPGQHGHHRAMTEAAHAVMDLAADPDFDGCALPPWEVKKLCLPAWSGAGQSYDDDLPPPPATFVYPATGRDPVTGWSYARMAQQSRVLHATQGMGRWVPTGQETDFPLHLAASRVPDADADLCSGLPHTLRDIDVPEIAGDLETAQAAVEAALAAFPVAQDILRHACAGLAALRRARPECPEGAWPDAGHRLVRKEAQMSRVIRLAAGVAAHGWFDADSVRAGQGMGWRMEVDQGLASVEVAPELPPGWQVRGDQVNLGDAARISDPYPTEYLPGEPVEPRLCLEVTAHGVTARDRVPFEVTPVVLPSRSAALTPASDVVNTAVARRTVEVAVSDVAPPGAATSLDAPDGWEATRTGAGFEVALPGDAPAGLHSLALTLDGEAARSVQHIVHPHVPPRILTRQAEVQVRVLHAEVPAVRVGYIGGGNDRVGHWLKRLGVDVTDLSKVELTDAVISGFDTLVIGIFAVRNRPGLAAAMPRLHGWMRAGGTMVTLYHRPWDGWDPDRVPPHRLEIGQPSLRWRVTDENARVKHSLPEHPLLNAPNVIGPGDWQGWHKERGLYFAKSWDAAYQPLLSMHDADEAPLEGALLVADVGQGRHVHCALILHHQMEKLVPGAFRIMANLLSKRE